MCMAVVRVCACMYVFVCVCVWCKQRAAQGKPNKQTAKQTVEPKSMQRFCFACCFVLSRSLPSVPLLACSPPPLFRLLLLLHRASHSNKNRLKHFTIAFWNCSNISHPLSLSLFVLLLLAS